LPFVMDGGYRFVWVPFLQDQQVVRKAAVQIRGHGLDTALLVDNKQEVVPFEVPEEFPPCVYVQAAYNVVEPNLPWFEGGNPLFLELDALDRIFCDKVSLGVPALDQYIGKIQVPFQLFDAA